MYIVGMYSVAKYRRKHDEIIFFYLIEVQSPRRRPSSNLKQLEL